MTKIAKDISVNVEGLERCDRYKTIYRTLDVAEQKNFRSDENMMKKAVSRCTREMIYDDDE
jgi:hypothetical protein